MVVDHSAMHLYGVEQRDLMWLQTIHSAGEHLAEPKRVVGDSHGIGGRNLNIPGGK